MSKNLQYQQLPETFEILKQLKDHLQNLIDLAGREKILLNDGKIDDLISILPSKINLLQQITGLNQQFNKFDKQQLQNIDKPNKTLVIGLYKILHELLLLNQTKFEVARANNSTIIHMISDHLIKDKKQAHNYNASGGTVIQNFEYKYMPPLTLSKRI